MSSSPFFITGAMCKIKVNGITLAYATDLSYSVRVAHAAPKVLGMYEAYTQEPLSYTVTGSFTVVRYVRGLKSELEKRGYTAPDDVSDRGNGVGSWIQDGLQNKATIGQGLATNYPTRADQSLDPDSLYNPAGFTVEVIQKASGNMEGVVARLRNCRIVASDFTVTKRGAATQTFSFQACYADEDSFLARESGVGQSIVG